MQHSPSATGQKLAAIILAAGRSARMGLFKPLLRFGDGSVIGHVVAQLRAAAVVEIHAVIGHHADEMRPVLDQLGVAAILNPDIDRGMFESVRLGIADLSPTVETCVVWPVDVPLVGAATVTRLLDAAADGAAWSVHPTFNGRRGHPIIVNRPLFDTILRAHGDGGLRALLAAHQAQAREVAVSDRFCLRDMDTPADYEALREALAQQVRRQAAPRRAR